MRPRWTSKDPLYIILGGLKVYYYYTKLHVPSPRNILPKEYTYCPSFDIAIAAFAEYPSARYKNRSMYKVWSGKNDTKQPLPLLTNSYCNCSLRRSLLKEILWIITFLSAITKPILLPSGTAATVRCCQYQQRLSSIIFSPIRLLNYMTNLLEESNVHLKTQSISSSVLLAAVPALSRPGHIDVHSYVVPT